MAFEPSSFCFAPLRCCRANAERTDQAVSRNPAAHRMRRDHVAEGIRSVALTVSLNCTRPGSLPVPRSGSKTRPCYRWLVERGYRQ